MMKLPLTLISWSLTSKYELVMRVVVDPWPQTRLIDLWKVAAESDPAAKGTIYSKSVKVCKRTLPENGESLWRNVTKNLGYFGKDIPESRTITGAYGVMLKLYLIDCFCEDDNTPGCDEFVVGTR